MLATSGPPTWPKAMRAFAISHTVHFSDQILLQRCNDVHSAGLQKYVAAA
ncbi:Uncharacterized protein AC496_3916 [Pseudomonas savastanoi pv. glycinea]|uniref:Uncharacterized protein n=2 Tax=Pseudomonas savastanoi pv. glycinea TaxID=318 RepID=A0ABR5LEA5_PSESG|nr:Uncharacterized protein AC514_2706 [Pseudomonas savastanoi pv. phaseolicola]KPB73562.1 Uncharacterized protein AC508_2465 [Pseudomonas amygdali pv. mellea]KPB83071.1 Uncharacterized protein AC504_4102 [Pseudomonas syringae pv. maculicola]KPC28038.1 Uncharacterized protein AC498_2753 [Pseudomonas savastanoi pv. glycinea]KPB43814.1 Uncharacterized protein AC515_1327 [Pseudomonas savastanoi pv. phaseolicola]